MLDGLVWGEPEQDRSGASPNDQLSRLTDTGDARRLTGDSDPEYGDLGSLIADHGRDCFRWSFTKGV